MDIFNKERIKELKEEIQELEEKKEKIQELEEKKEKIKKRMEKEKKRAKKSVTEKQEAERENNVLEQKIETLKDKLKRAKKGEKIVKYEPVVELDMDALKKLEHISKKDLKEDKTIYHIPKLFDIEVDFPVSDLSKKRGYIVVFSNTGAVFTAKGLDIIDYNIVKSDIHPKHSKGGYSANRFERGIEKQINRHVKKIKENMDVVKDLKCIVSGDEILAKKFDFPYLSSDVSKVKDKNDLEKALRSIWELKGEIKG